MCKRRRMLSTFEWDQNRAGRTPREGEKWKETKFLDIAEISKKSEGCCQNPLLQWRTPSIPPRLNRVLVAEFATSGTNLPQTGQPKTLTPLQFPN